MNSKKLVSTKYKSLKSLSLENLQGMILWCYLLKLSHKKRSPSFFSINNASSLNSVNLFFLNTNPKQKSETIFINEFINYSSFKRYLISEINYRNKNFDEIKKEEIERFLLKDIRLAYSNYELTIPSQVSLFEIDTVKYFTPSLETEYFLVSMDCEMLITDLGKEIGRVSILDHKYNVIFDTFVKPKGIIQDYLFEYSGLTKENIKNGIEFEELQNKLLKIIGKNTIILGHALENDLVLLKIKHNLIIDTSHLYKTHENKRQKLKFLLSKIFDKEIQTDMHSSIEDAKSCLDLFNNKISQYKSAEESFKNQIFFLKDHKIYFVKENDISFDYFRNKNLNVISCSYTKVTELISQIKDTSVNFIFFEDEEGIQMIKEI
ncbi:rna exonuclease [Tubulinosema ratisbonensis]|uniref:Rna exonuclease n=1 Tax=Tubulinosema ratisbonensis TaxID=291195 RepID=A0A437ANV3_9MICR|nr:rna exonuclease [Tubulinosema ratisbonensis]